MTARLLAVEQFVTVFKPVASLIGRALAFLIDIRFRPRPPSEIARHFGGSTERTPRFCNRRLSAAAICVARD